VGEKTTPGTGKEAGWAAISFWTLREENMVGNLCIT